MNDKNMERARISAEVPNFGMVFIPQDGPKSNDTKEPAREDSKKPKSVTGFFRDWLVPEPVRKTRKSDEPKPSEYLDDRGMFTEPANVAEGKADRNESVTADGPQMVRPQAIINEAGGAPDIYEHKQSPISQGFKSSHSFDTNFPNNPILRLPTIVINQHTQAGINYEIPLPEGCKFMRVYGTAQHMYVSYGGTPTVVSGGSQAVENTLYIPGNYYTPNLWNVEGVKSITIQSVGNQPVSIQCWC